MIEQLEINNGMSSHQLLFCSDRWCALTSRPAPVLLRCARCWHVPERLKCGGWWLPGKSGSQTLLNQQVACCAHVMHGWIESVSQQFVVWRHDECCAVWHAELSWKAKKTLVEADSRGCGGGEGDLWIHGEAAFAWRLEEAGGWWCARRLCCVKRQLCGGGRGVGESRKRELLLTISWKTPRDALGERMVCPCPCSNLHHQRMCRMRAVGTISM